MAVEKGVTSKKSIAAEFDIPQSMLSTRLKKQTKIKKNYISGSVAQ